MMMATMRAAGNWCWPPVKMGLRLVGELALAIGFVIVVVLATAGVVAMVKGFCG